MIKVKSKYRNMMANCDDQVIHFKNYEALVTPQQATLLVRRPEYSIVDEQEYSLALHKNIVPEYDPDNITFTISLVCFNQLQVTKKCLTALFVKTQKFNYEVLITDNGSDQGTIDYLKSFKSDRIRITFNESNEGFMNPHIKALEHAKGRFFIVLNNDFYIQDDYWLEKIFNEFVVDPEIRVVGPLAGSLNSDGTGRIEKGLTYDYIEGSCLCIPTEFAREINLFDNQLLSFAYCEDSDLSLRVRSMGYKIKRLTFPHIHDQGSTTRNPDVYPLIRLIASRNHFKFRTRWDHYLKTRKFTNREVKKLPFKMDKLYTFNRDKFLKSKNVILAREVGIGDVMFFTTCCSWLKSINKNVKITFATNYTNRRVVQNNPFINKVIPYESIRDQSVLAEYDYGIHFVPFFGLARYQKRELQKHRIDLIREYFGAKVSDWDPTLYYKVTDLEKIWVDNLLSKRDLRKGVVTVVLSTTDSKRNYPRCRDLIHTLIDHKYFVIVIDKHRVNFPTQFGMLNLTGQTTLSHTAALIDRSDLVITPDTGILHLAGALKKNILTFFNSFPSKVRTRYYKNCFAYELWQNCEGTKGQPCLYSQDNPCPMKRCFREISPEVLVLKAQELEYLKV